MLVKKTIKAKVIDPTNRKQELLEREYYGFQKILSGEEVSIYSVTKQQAQRLLRKIKRPKPKEYPLIIRRDLVRLEKRDTKIATYWFKFRCFGVWGGIWLGIKPHCDIPLDCSFREAKLIRRKNSWFIHLTIEREVPEPVIRKCPILAVDLGERYLATVCGSDGIISPQFLGKEVRGIRRHYAWLRKRLGERKLLKIIKKVGDTEKRKVNDICHKISRQIVNEAKKSGSIIVLGDLKGIRKKAKGRRMKRIVSNMPYFKLTQFIKYKAAWEGIPVLIITEAYTSKTCHRCGYIGVRRSQAFFYCPHCGLQSNADLNGAQNLLKRSLSYIGRDGAALTQPLTQVGT